MMRININNFRVAEDEKVQIGKWRTEVKRYYKSKKHYAKLPAERVEQMSDRQSLLYAHNRYALLLIFQAMDAAGKDGAIKHVMSGITPQGCEVFSFKQPSAQELAHDFLWCTTRWRFLARIDDPDKNWKFSAADLAERALWNHYQRAYEECLTTTSTKHAPWYVVPADDKQNARLIISQVILDTLDNLKMRYPQPDKNHRQNLQVAREQRTR